MTLLNNERLQNLFAPGQTPFDPNYNYAAHDTMDGALEIAKLLLHTSEQNTAIVHQSAHRSAFDIWYDNLDPKKKKVIRAKRNQKMFAGRA